MKKSLLIILLLATAAVLGSAVAFSAETTPIPSAPRGVHAKRWVWERAREKLGLTDEQVDRIKIEIRAEKPALTESLHKLHAARVVLRGTIQKPGATEAEIRSAALAVGNAGADLAVLRARVFARIRPVLTPEQLEKFNALQGKLAHRIDRAFDGEAARGTE